MNQREIEKKWQETWKKQGTFNSKPDLSKQKYFSTVPYPYANSVLHIGHGRSYTSADIFTRYQRLLGKNVLFPMAYHISGTPVLAVADGIARGDEKQINLTRDAISDYIEDKVEQDNLLETFKDPQNIANFFTKTIESSLNSIGISIDWRRQFTTGDPIYNKFVEWQYKKLHEAGILVQGKYPILYSPLDGNAVGEDDIKDGDLDKVAVQEMKYIMFKIQNSEDHLVAATLRPDSIFGATNIYVKPEMDLVKLKVESSIWIVSKASQIKIEHQFDNVEFISEHKGKEFLNKEVLVPILNKIVPVYPMEYPDENHGTGIVYSSPADSPHDYIHLFELKFPGKSLKDYEEDPLNLTPITSTKDKKGNVITYKSNIPAFDKLHKLQIYSIKGNEEKLEQAKEELYKEAHFGAVMINCDEFDGTPLKNNVGANKVKEKLEELKLGGVFYETSRRAKTRGGDPVIVANLNGQWFLDYSDDEVKQKAYDVLDSMTYYPTKLKETQKGYLKWVTMRPCARRRGIGTPLPYDREWIIEPLSDSTIYQMLYLVYHIIIREGLSEKQLPAKVWDYIFFGKGNKKMISGHFKISEEVLKEMRDEVEYWKSFDFRYTAGSHMSNHLSFLIYHYGLIFEKEYHPKNITVGGMLIKDGEKISKSKGNGIQLSRVGDKYGVDLYRLYVAVASNFDTEMDFKDEEIEQLSKKFSKWKEIISKSLDKEEKRYEDYSQTNKWLISRFYSRIKEYFDHFNNIRIREAYVAVLYEFLIEIAYHERRTSLDETLEVIRFFAKDYIKVMTPTIPHIAEELFSKFNDGFVSLAKFETDVEKYISSEDEDIENIVQELVNLIGRTKETKNMSKLSSIKIVQATQTRFDLFDDLSELLSRTKNVKEIFSELNSKFSKDSKFIRKFVPKTLGSGLSSYLSKEKEKELLVSIKTFLEEEFKAKVEIITAEEAGLDISTIMPGRPGVILE